MTENTQRTIDPSNDLGDLPSGPRAPISHADWDRVCAELDKFRDFVETLENDDGAIPDWLWARRNVLLGRAK
jgi:hypothetical protein